MNVKLVLKELKALGKPDNLKGMSRFGINTENAYGDNMPDIRKLARKYKHNHILDYQTLQKIRADT